MAVRTDADWDRLERENLALRNENARLQAENASLRELVAALERHLANLGAEVQSLGRKLDEKPPPPREQSPMPPAPPKTPTGRKRGAQPGHPPHLKKLLPPERVNQTIPYVPHTCSACHAALPQERGPNDPEPKRHQVAELPDVTATIIEHQAHARICPECRKLNCASIPENVLKHCYGPRFAATMTYLVATHGVSRRGAEEISQDLFGAPISLGSVSNLERETNAALEPCHEEAKAHVQTEPVKNVDETGWTQAGNKRWAWLAATASIAVFMIDRLRNGVALAKLLGSEVVGILCSDRAGAYDQHDILKRQLCWAHLKRNIESHQKRGGAAKRFADDALDVVSRVFEAWHLFRGGGSRKQLDIHIAALMLDFRDIISVGFRSRDKRLVRFCARLARQYAGFWTFAVLDGVEPTNNHAERMLRRLVIWRRRSFGCQSERGCRFVERTMTVVQSLRMQNRSVLGFLQESLTAHRAGVQGPSLLRKAA